MPLRVTLVAFLLGSGLFGVLGACSSGSGSASPVPSGGADGGRISCATDPRVTPFASGMQAKSASGRLVVEIVTATPSPPQRGAGDAGMNEWSVKVTVDGAPAQASAVTVSTLMPDHGHGSPRIPTVAANADGTLGVAGLYLFMGGVWQITFTTDGGESATLSLCVE